MSPFKRAPKYRIALIRKIVIAVRAWERSCGTTAQTLPPTVFKFYGGLGSTYSLSEIDLAITPAMKRAWKRVETRDDYEAIYERYRDQHMARFKPREWEIVKFRREIEGLRRELREHVEESANES